MVMVPFQKFSQRTNVSEADEIIKLPRKAADPAERPQGST